MRRELKLLILSLLGFSAACTGVKNSTKSPTSDQTDTTTMRTVVRPEIRLMYGPPRPMPAETVEPADSLRTPQPADARSVKQPEDQPAAQHDHPIVTMYGVRVPMQNIDLDSLKRAQQQRQQQPAAEQDEQNEQ